MKKEPLDVRLQRHRRTNTRGMLIPQHHAFKKIQLGPVSRLALLLLPALFITAIWLSLAPITALWAEMFRFWMPALGQGDVAFRQVSLLGQSLDIPYAAVEADLPTHNFVLIHLGITVALFVFSFILPPSALPLAYLLRAALLVHASSAVYFLISPHMFPYDLAGYTVNALLMGLCLLLLLPLVFAAAYYVFHFPLWQKCAVTLATILFFILALPMQYLVHTYLLHKQSLLLLPLLFFMFGMLLDILMLICFYSIGMSWGSRTVMGFNSSLQR